MTSRNLLKFKSVQYWLEGLNEDTKRKYLEYFRPFPIHVKMSPDEIITQRKEDLKSDDMQMRKRFEHIAKEWYHAKYEQFEREGKSTGHAYNYLKAVMSFFSRNDLPLKYKRKELKKVKKKIKRTLIDIEDLKTAYTMLDVRAKAIFTTLLQSGLSEIDVCALNIEDILSQLDKNIVYLEGYREKTTARYQTCIGEDACISIQKYLLLRGNPKEGALFLSKFGERLTARAIREELQVVQKVIPNFQVKMLRDIFHDALERSNIKEALATRMFGHELPSAKGSYEFSPTTVKEAYIRAYPFLKVDDITRTTSRDKSTAELIIKLGEVVSIIATEGQQGGLIALTNLISELKVGELTPIEKKALETLTTGTLKQPLTESDKQQIRKIFSDTLRTYLQAI